MLQNSSSVTGSVAQVVIDPEPPGLPSARANTEYVVTPSLFGSGLGRRNDAEPSVPLASSTAKSPSDSRIFVFEVRLEIRLTKIRCPWFPVMSADFPLGTPIRFRL